MRAMGIIFPNMHDQNIPEITMHRTMASVPFAGRYRMIDFPLSGMAQAGVQNIAVLVRRNYQSLMDHLGNGREWDLSRKRGGLVIYPPYSHNTSLYHGRMEGLSTLLDYIEHQKEELVIMSDCDIACNVDYAKLLAEHDASGADVTLVYEKAPIAEKMQSDNVTLKMNSTGRVTELRINDYKKGPQNLFMHIYVIGREQLINIVKDSIVRGNTHFDRDFLAKNLKTLLVKGHECHGYHARIYDLRSYFCENLRLINQDNLAALFAEERPIYTKVRDEAPVRYAIGANITNSLVADGSIIEGEVENCVLFRGVRVGKGAKLKNCVIMQGTQIGAGVQMAYVICDKNVTIADTQNLRGAENFPVFIAKNSNVM